jgi:hypothetical protein
MIPRNKSSCDFLITTFAKFFYLVVEREILVSVNNRIIYVFFKILFYTFYKLIFIAPVGGTLDKKVTVLKR